jgi:photosystem II stability/assembly factor-like uncharacterized protein
MAKNIVNVILVSLLIFLLGGYICFAGEVEWQDIGRGILDINTVLINPDNPRIIYIGSSKGIFKTEDGGVNWRNILSVKGQNKAVNFLLFDPKDKNSLYTASGNGLSYSTNQGRDWKRIFQGKNYLENECTALAVLPYALYLGTKGGFFVSSDKGHTWQKASGKIGNSHILAIACNIKEPDYIYVACVDGVFKTGNAGKTWERIFVASPTENGNDLEEQTSIDVRSRLMVELRPLDVHILSLS